MWNNVFQVFDIFLTGILLIPVAFLIWLYFHDKYQSQHSINRNFRIVGHIREISNKLGPKLRQYWFLNDKEEKPMDRNTYETVVKHSKYGNSIQSFGSLEDFSKPRHYLSNSMFPVNDEEIKVDNSKTIIAYKYNITKETPFSRKEKLLLDEKSKPWYLHDDDKIIIGPNSKNPFAVRSVIGISAMSFGALSKSAVKALAQGTIISGESWFNTGEGGISKYHLSKIYEIHADHKDVDLGTSLIAKVFYYIKESMFVSNFELEEEFGKDVFEYLGYLIEDGYVIEKSANLVFQISSGLYGAREKDQSEPIFSEEAFVKNASRPEVKAIEIKLAQGAKTKGGHVEGVKVTPEIADIRGVMPYKTIESPNRFKQFNDTKSLFEFIEKLKILSEKPVGIKVVIGANDSLDEIAQYMKETNQGPDFITVDGGEGGTGATFQEMADSVGLPIYSAIMIVDDTLRKYGVRDNVKLIASGMLATADKAAIVLSMGADLINVARAAMNTVGCINARECHTNHCPTGVTSHLPELEQGLVVTEKRLRTANYLTSMRKSIFTLAAACGENSPVRLQRKHVSFNDQYSVARRLDEIHPYQSNKKD